MAKPPANLPSSHPAEVLDISPEALEIANAYLQNPNIAAISDELGVPTQFVTQTLDRREVKAYVDGVFMNMGFNNRFKLRAAMDAIISKKFQELEEAGIGSSKDIIEILTLSHKMSMDELDRQLALEKLRAPSLKNQVNVQINDSGSNYGNLIERLLKDNTINE